jgi:hypothetical protein
MADIQFIECTSLSIAYDVFGIATVSFVVVANGNDVDLTNYQTLTIGGANYSGYITSVVVKPITGTLWYEYSVSLTMTSER